MKEGRLSFFLVFPSLPFFCLPLLLVTNPLSVHLIPQEATEYGL